MVCEQIWSTLYDYPRLRECRGLLGYIGETVRLAWALSIQNPPYLLKYDCKTFSDDRHVRFHSSDPGRAIIRSFIWPSLREGEHGPFVFKGVVVT